jgi:hypothetical protein
MDRFRHPEGTQLPALEKNVLKYRAFEMILTIFYAEELKRKIVGAIESTDAIKSRNNPRITPTTKNKFQRAMQAIVTDGVVTSQERDEIVALIDTRNGIAHSIHEMTFDISRDSFARGILEYERPKYNLQALSRLKYFYKELPRRMMSRYSFILSFNDSLFRSARKTYEAELKRLDKKIQAQFRNRDKQNRLLKRELSLKDTEFENNMNILVHPMNIARNGNLSKRGTEICFRLFDLGKRPIAVAYLMYISLKAARRHCKRWQKSSGS